MDRACETLRDLTRRANQTQVPQNECKTHFSLSLRHPNEEVEALGAQGGAGARNKTPTAPFTSRGMQVDGKT